jgi:hypothetical protein
VTLQNISVLYAEERGYGTQKNDLWRCNLERINIRKPGLVGHYFMSCPAYFFLSAFSCMKLTMDLDLLKRSVVTKLYNT